MKHFGRLMLVFFVLLGTTGCREEVVAVYERVSTGSSWMDAAILAGVTALLSLIAYVVRGTMAVMVVCCTLVYFTIDIGGAVAAAIVVMTGAGMISLLQDLVKSAKEKEREREELRESNQRELERERQNYREKHGHDKILPPD